MQALFRMLAELAPLCAVRVMQAWAAEGVREDEGSNRGSVVDAIHEVGYGDDDDAAPWCARAVQAAWRIAGWSTLQRLDSRISRSGSVFYMLHSTHDRLPRAVLLCEHIDEKTPDGTLQLFMQQLQPGDALIRYSMLPEHEGTPFDKRTRAMMHKGHTEIVSRVYDDGRVDTVGGNTASQTDARDGNGVFAHSRLYSVRESRVVGFVRPIFVPL